MPCMLKLLQRQVTLVLKDGNCSVHQNVSLVCMQKYSGTEFLGAAELAQVPSDR